MLREHFPTAVGRRHRGAVRALVAALVLSVAGSAEPAAAQEAGYLRAVDITFPIAGVVQTADTYHAYRGGGTRRHQATDIMAPKGTPVYAAQGGEITQITGVTEAPPSYGYVVTIAGVDGLTYNYIHLNNDTPGTDDGSGGAANAYAPGIRRGVTVRRGQFLGYLGDSGNAENTPSHLHFEIKDPNLSDRRIGSAPYHRDRLNPYPSLMAARARGDVPTPVVLKRGMTSPAVAAWQAQVNRVLGGRAVPVTGHFGPQTEFATLRLQRTVAVGADGVVGPATLAAAEDAIGSRVRAPAPPSRSDRPRLLRLAVPPQQGDDVASFQRRLRDLGYRTSGGAPLPVDGVFGPETDRAARAFQGSAGLDPIGIVGPKTLAALGRAEERRTGTASTASWPGRYLRLEEPYLRGRDVAAFQQRLRDLGYRNSGGGPLEADGVYGPETDRAARAFIRRAGLPDIPVVGPKTWTAAFN